MIYKKIQDQISQQTRVTPQQADFQGFAGSSFNTGKDVNVPGGVNDGIGNIAWDKYSYILQKAVYTFRWGTRTWTLVSKDFIPVIDVDSYNNYHPEVEEPDTVYNYWSYTGNISYNRTDSTLLGSIYEPNIKNDSNIAYGIFVPASRNTSSSLELLLEGDDISCSVWYVPKGTTTAVNNIVAFTTGVNRLQINQPRTVNIPISEFGTEIWVMIYKHYDFFGKNPGITESSWFKVTPNVVLKELGGRSVSFSNLSAPTWSDDIYSSSNPITGNVVNVLKINKPTEPYWRGISVYRKDRDNINSNIARALDSYQISGGFELSTSNSRLFIPGTNLVIGPTLYQVEDSYVAKANYVKNADFAQYSGTNLTNWSKVASVPATVHLNRVTAAPFQGDRVFNTHCVRMYSYKTNTAKSYYIEPSNYVNVANLSKPVLSLYARLDSGYPTGDVAIRFFSSSDGTLCTPKHKYYDLNPNYVSTNRSWVYYHYPLSQSFDSSRPNYIPSNCKYIKPRIYSSNNSTSMSVYHIDGVKVSDYYYKDVFHTAASDKAVTKLKGFYEEPHKSLTTFKLYFEDDTTKSWNNVTYADRVYNRPQYVHTTGIAYNYGMAFVDGATSYVANGDFSGGINNWTNANFTPSIVNQYSPYNNFYGRFISRTKNATLRQTYNGGAGFVHNSAFCCAVWAKSPIRNQLLKVKLDNNSTQISSATFVLSSVWNQYTVKKQFASGGVNIGYSIIVPTSSPSEIHLAGVQVEARKSYISDFNFRSTAIPNYRRKQGLRYTSATGIDWSYGTIRMWYTPKLNYSTNAGVYRTLFHYYQAASHYQNLYYDPSISRFSAYRAGGGLASNVNSTVVAFSTGQPMHIVLTWNKKVNASNCDEVTMYVNGKRGEVKTGAFWNTSINTTGTIHIGCNRSSAEAANGIISNFRIDKYPWGPDEVENDYRATGKTLETLVDVGRENYVHVGDLVRTSDEPSSYISFTDDQGIENDKTYWYAAATFDASHNESALSTTKSVYTPRKPNEYYNINKIANSSFEVYDSNKVRYWADTATTPTTGGGNLNRKYTRLAFTGKNSIRHTYLAQKYPLTYQYVYKESTTSALTVSWYTHTSGAEDVSYESGFINELKCSFYDDRLVNIANRVYTSFSTAGINREQDDEYWVRYSTAFSNTSGFLNYTTAIAVKYIKLGFQKSAYGQALIDAVQVTEIPKPTVLSAANNVESYRENYQVAAGNLGPDSVDGNAISWYTLTGKHFRASELVISTADGDLERILIGQETSDKSFSVLSRDFFRYHSPGLPTASGWNYTKHIENGVGVFGNTYSYQNRYYNWNNNPVPPILIVTPKEIYTYSTAATVPQKVFFTQVNSASGFTVNAYLTHASTTPHTHLIPRFKVKESVLSAAYTNPTGYTYSTEIHSYGGGGVGQFYQQAGATVLSYRSKHSNGLFKYYLWYEGGRGAQYNIDLNFYCTSQSVREFSTGSAWVKIGSDQKTITETNTEYTSYFANDRFSTAKSFAVEINTVPEGSDFIYYLDPRLLEYTTVNPRIYKSGSTMGSYYWISIDGGIIG